jgi:hypothetical protein
MMLLTIIALLEAALQRDGDTKVVIATDSNAIRDSFTRHPQVSIRQHTSAYVSMRQHASAYVAIRDSFTRHPQGLRLY